MGNYLNYIHEKVIRVSLSECHTSGNLVRWFVHEELWLKRDYNTLLQFGTVVHVQTNTINLWIFPYKC